MKAEEKLRRILTGYGIYVDDDKSFTIANVDPAVSSLDDMLFSIIINSENDVIYLGTYKNAVSIRLVDFTPKEDTKDVVMDGPDATYEVGTLMSNGEVFSRKIPKISIVRRVKGNRLISHLLDIMGNRATMGVITHSNVVKFEKKGITK